MYTSKYFLGIFSSSYYFRPINTVAPPGDREETTEEKKEGIKKKFKKNDKVQESKERRPKRK